MNNIYLALNFALSDDNVPKQLLLVPAGRFQGRDGRAWTNDNPQAVIDATVAQNQEIPFDVEHSTHIKAPKGEEAAAIGWIDPSTLVIIDGAIYGDVEWNTRGGVLLRGKQYKYYSPSFTFDRNGRVVAIASSGLTNKPNLTQITALNRTEEPSMKQLLIALGLTAAATEDQALTALNSLKSSHQIALNSAQSQAPDLSKFVPIETHQLALNRASDAETTLATNAKADIEARAKTLVEQAVADGKCAPANSDDYLAMCHMEGGLEKVTNLFANAPKVIVADQNPKEKIDGDSKLSETELAVCHALDMDEETFLSTKAQS